MQQSENPNNTEASPAIMATLAKQGFIFQNIHRPLSAIIAKSFDRFSNTFLLIIGLLFFIGLGLCYSVLQATGSSILIAGIGMYIMAIIKDGLMISINRNQDSNKPIVQLAYFCGQTLLHTFFYACLGFGLYTTGQHELFFYASIVLIALGLYITGKVANGLLKKNETKGETRHIKTDYSHYIKSFFGIELQDVSALAIAIGCLASFLVTLFYIAFVLAFVLAIGYASQKKNNKGGFSMPDPFFFYIIGVVLLCTLIYNMNIDTIFDSLKEVGYSVIWVFFTAILWVIVNSYSVSILVKHKVPFKTLVYTDLTGNAYNNIIPLAGLGGEPYKIKVMSDYIGVANASRVTIQNRLINSTTAFLYTGLVVLGTLLLVDLSSQMFTFLAIGGAISGLIGLVISGVTLSTAPGKLSGFLLQKLNFLKEYTDEPLSTKQFLGASVLQILGRALNLVEIYVIYLILDFSPSIADVVCVSTFLSISGAIFWIIPQGLGVSEASISTAFSILGYSTSLGLTFGLLRRARVIFWAIAGVLIHMISLMLERKNQKGN